MSRPTYLADHDLNDHIIQGVERREPTLPWVRAREVGLARRADDVLLAYAAKERLIVVSHDVRTMSAAAAARLDQGQPMNGLFLIIQEHPIAPAIEELILIWAASEAEEWAGQIRFLPL